MWASNWWRRTPSHQDVVQQVGTTWKSHSSELSQITQTSCNMPLDELIIAHSKISSEMTSDRPTADNRRTGTCSRDKLWRWRLNLPQGYIPYITCAETACCELHAWDKGYASQKPAQQSRGNTLSVSNSTVHLRACLSLRLELKALNQGHMRGTRSPTRDAHSVIIVACLQLIIPSEHPLLAQQLGQKVKEAVQTFTLTNGPMAMSYASELQPGLYLRALSCHPLGSLTGYLCINACFCTHPAAPWHWMVLGRQKETAWHADANGAFTSNNLWTCTGQPASQHYISAEKDMIVPCLA